MVPGDAAQVEHGAAQGLERGKLELAARELGIGRGDLHAAEAERLRGMVAVEREVDAVAGGAAQRVGIDPSRGVTCTLRIVDEGLGPASPPHAGRGHDGALQVGIAGQRSEEHTSELQSIMRISYAVLCLKKKIKT